MAGKHDVARTPRDPAPGGALGDALAAAGSVYDAALDPARWPEALTIVAETLGAAAAVLIVGTPGRESAVVAATYGLEPGAALACAAVDAARDPLLKAAGQRSGRPVASGAEVGERALAASELGRLVLAPCGLRHALAIALAPGGTGFAAAQCFRAAAPPFGTAERDLLAAWAPHLRRALEIQQGLAEAASRSAASEQLLDRLTLGAIVVDEEARPVMTNRFAERLLAAGDGLCSNPSGLTGSTSAATARLRAAVRETVREAAASGRVRSAGLRLERPRHPRPYEVIVVSLRERCRVRNMRD